MEKLVRWSGPLMNSMMERLDVYLSSFEIDIEKRTTIQVSLQKENFRETKFILYKQKLKDKTNDCNFRPLGCCLLFPTDEVLALTVETHWNFRTMGIASSLLNFAITYASMNGFDLLGLQSLHSYFTQQDFINDAIFHDSLYRGYLFSPY